MTEALAIAALVLPALAVALHSRANRLRRLDKLNNLAFDQRAEIQASAMSLKP